MPSRVALYCRVSTAEQTTEPQLHALRQYASARGLEVAEEYEDVGVSGAKERRPALDRLLAEARRRRFDVLAVVKLDRLARRAGGCCSTPWQLSPSLSGTSSASV